MLLRGVNQGGNNSRSDLLADIHGAAVKQQGAVPRQAGDLDPGEGVVVNIVEEIVPLEIGSGKRVAGVLIQYYLGGSQGLTGEHTGVTPSQGVGDIGYRVLPGQLEPGVVNQACLAAGGGFVHVGHDGLGILGGVVDPDIRHLTVEGFELEGRTFG